MGFACQGEVAEGLWRLSRSLYLTMRSWKRPLNVTPILPLHASKCARRPVRYQHGGGTGSVHGGCTPGCVLGGVYGGVHRAAKTLKRARGHLPKSGKEVKRALRRSKGVRRLSWDVLSAQFRAFDGSFSGFWRLFRVFDLSLAVRAQFYLS